MTTWLVQTNNVQNISLIKKFAEKLGVNIIEINEETPITNKLSGIFASKKQNNITDKQAKEDFLVDKYPQLL